MMRMLPLLLLLLLLYPTLPARADAWTLVFQDDFEREAIGDDWHVTDSEIRDGRMLVGVNGTAGAYINRPFPADVRLEFEAEAFEHRPPCDLSVTMAAESLRDFTWNYLFQFGGQNNSTNRIIGGRNFERQEVHNPDKMIEHGRVYRIVATKEGQRLSFEVNGEPMMEGWHEEIMGGPGYDRIGVVTWGGMYIDKVRAYERATPHPDTPDYIMGLQGLALTLDDQDRLTAAGPISTGCQAAVEAYNRGDLRAAQAAFMDLEGEEQAAGLAYVYGHLNHDESKDDFPRVAELFQALARANPDDERLREYAWAADLFGHIRIWPRDPHACSLLTYLGPEHNPFYDKARLFGARFLRASGQESGVRKDVENATKVFRELLEKVPDHVVLRQLTGENIPWRQDLIIDDPNVPRWAALLHEMYARQLIIMEWWFSVRQFPNGELGGGWGDDVEILRSWGPFAMISDASPEVRNGIERLAQGVWDEELIDGFDKRLGDVEHSAEPSADSIPTMLALRYGDPLWFERNLTSCRRIRDYYIGIDEQGYVRVKSGYIGGDEYSTNVQDGGDNYYSTRAMKHFYWAGWYGNEDAKALYLNWVQGWVHATMTPRHGKPAGVLPANIWYPSGDIAAPTGAPWYDPDLNIYGCCSIGNFWMQDTFCAAYSLSGNPYFLQPLHAWMDFANRPLPQDLEGEPDIESQPELWARHNARHSTWNHDRPLGWYRWMTGDTTYDERYGWDRPQQRLHLPGDLERTLHLVERLLVNNLRLNWDLHTREVIQTDRASLAGSGRAFAAYSGGLGEWVDAGVPTMAVTWDAPHSDFAALVTHTTPRHLRIWLYNFADEPMSMGMMPWTLEPGLYRLTGGELMPGDDYEREYEPSLQDDVAHRTRAQPYYFDLPSRQEFVVDLRIRELYDVPATLPDPAIHDRDLVLDQDEDGNATLTATIHNLGSAPAQDLEVALLDAAGMEIDRRRVQRLAASANLLPSTVAVTFANVRATGELHVVLDPDQTLWEINEINNSARVER